MVGAWQTRSPWTGEHITQAVHTVSTIPLGLYEKALPEDLSWRDRLHIAAEQGFAFVEMSIDETDHRLARLQWSESEREAVRRETIESGVPIQSICLSGHRRFALGSSDSETRERALQILNQGIEFAADLGVRVIQLAGYDVYYEEGDERSVERFVDGIRRGLAHAARRQVMLAVEIMDTAFMGSIVRFLNLKRQLPSPWLTVYPDVGNLSAWGNDVGEELTLAIDQIVGIHLKDTRAVSETHIGTFRDVPFGTGCVDFVGVFRRLAALRYGGPLLMEMWAGDRSVEQAVQEVAAARHWIVRQMIEGGYAQE
jgi:hexulose-6-phosphate isomerase